MNADLDKQCPVFVLFCMGRHSHEVLWPTHVNNWPRTPTLSGQQTSFSLHKTYLYNTTHPSLTSWFYLQVPAIPPADTQTIHEDASLWWNKPERICFNLANKSGEMGISCLILVLMFTIKMEIHMQNCNCR